MKAILRTSLPMFLLAAAATAGVAEADPNNPSDNDKAAARPFAIEGLRLAQAGNCREAVEQLERCEALVHAPTTEVPLAQCDIQLGKVIAGTEILNRVLNTPLPPNVPSSWADAKRQARAVLDAAQPRVAKLRIHVDLPPGVQPNLEVTVDGQPVPLVLLDNERPTDPGPHHIVALQAGMGSAEADVTLADGQIRPVDLRIAPAGGGAVVAPPAGVPDPYSQGPAAPAPAPPSVPDAGTPWMAFEFGARLAFGLPFGGLAGGNGNDLDHTVSNMFIPLWLDAGFRLASHWYVGSYFSYGLTSLSNQFLNGTCGQQGYGCSSSDIRLGIDASYHVLPDGRFDPWFGLGFGYEWLSLGVTADANHELIAPNGANVLGPANESAGDSGWEFVNFQAGLDFRLLQDALGVGPFLSLAISQYTSQSNPTDVHGGTTGSSITNQALHEWFMFGARGDYDLKF